MRTYQKFTIEIIACIVLIILISEWKFKAGLAGNPPAVEAKK